VFLAPACNRLSDINTRTDHFAAGAVQQMLTCAIAVLTPYLRAESTATCGTGTKPARLARCPRRKPLVLMS
jgi:hypothetical protein